jgi:hypothetical protein
MPARTGKDTRLLFVERMLLLPSACVVCSATANFQQVHRRCAVIRSSWASAYTKAFNGMHMVKRGARVSSSW